MASFNIEAHIGSGNRLEWLALPSKGERIESVVQQVKQAAIDKFGGVVYFNRWEHVVSSNGYVTVRMCA